jgi:hypothetical protein
MTTVTHDLWPDLALDEWKATYATLHRWLQIVGKTRLALAPMQNHWWQVTLYVTVRGFGTSPMPVGDRSVEVDFDFVDHALVVRTSDGATRTMPLGSYSVAEFYRAYTALLQSVDVRPKIYPVPMELPDTLRFTDDTIHASYDPDAAQRCWRLMAQTDRVFKEFRGRFLGKSSPSQLWWGGFDLACTRFSGRRAPRYAAAVPNCPAYVMVEGYSRECISAGLWPGAVDGPVAETAFYAYSYPEPAGCDIAPVRPEAARYHPVLREWILPYEAVRQSADPDAALLEFLQSTYEAAADRGGWDRATLERQPGDVMLPNRSS